MQQKDQKLDRNTNLLSKLIFATGIGPLTDATAAIRT
jgi:hypothetical protein